MAKTLIREVKVDLGRGYNYPPELVYKWVREADNMKLEKTVSGNVGKEAQHLADELTRKLSAWASSKFQGSVSTKTLDGVAHLQDSEIRPHETRFLEWAVEVKTSGGSTKLGLIRSRVDNTGRGFKIKVYSDLSYNSLAELLL